MSPPKQLDVPLSFSTPMKDRNMYSVFLDLLPAPTTAENVEEELKHELKDSVYLNTPKFLETIFDVDIELIEKVHNTLLSMPGFKGEHGNLSLFPAKVTSEKALCDSFIKVANTIVDLLHHNKTWLTPTEQEVLDTLEARWISDPDQPPKNNSRTGSLAKPDFLYVHHAQAVINKLEARKKALPDCRFELNLNEMTVSQSNAIQKLDSYMYIASQSTSRLDPFLSDSRNSVKEPRTSVTSTPASNAALNEDLGPLWIQVLHVGEAKLNNSPKLALLQVLRYCRQVFQECHDRRSVLGFSLTGENLLIYQADRTGILGSSRIDINKVFIVFVSSWLFLILGCRRTVKRSSISS
jgi:hypothetical protein